jgi:hypothetical protein
MVKKIVGDHQAQAKQVPQMINDPNLNLKKKGNKKLILRWLYQRVTARRRSLPNFIIVGTAKGGTTSLFEYICKHPDMLPPFRKQIKFFFYNYELGLSWYRAHFPLRRQLALNGAITGEATPNYMFRPKAVERIAAILPNIKIIVLLRDPVDRAYSHYNYIQRVRGEEYSFDEALEREIRFEQQEGKPVAEESPTSEIKHPNRSYIARGRYFEQISRLFELFSEENILIHKSEDFFDSPSKIFLETLQFLGLPGWEPPKYEVFKQGGYAPLNPETKTKLKRYYQPYNQKLFEYLNRDFGWDN